MPERQNSDGQKVIVSGVVSTDSYYKNKDLRIVLDSEKYGKIYVMTDTKQSIVRSDKLTLAGELSDGFGSYDGFVYHPTIIEIAHPDAPDLATSMRDSFSERIEQLANSEEQSALALSYLTGQKTKLSEDLRNELRIAGLSHVVVASGFHLSVVVGFAKKRFGKLSRFATITGAIMLMVIYISVTGFSPSMVRAGLMTAISLFAWYFGRRIHPARLILYVIAISLLIDTSLIKDIAWQLSFASYAGIIFINPLITKFLYGDKQPGFISNLILVSLSAQLACLPLSIYYFGAVSGLAIVSNILISPTISVVMLLTLLTGITGLIPLAFLMNGLVSLHLFIVDKIASLSWAAIELPANNPAIFMIYLILILPMIYLKSKTGHSYRPSYAIV